jgi:hypothetical protein
MKRQSYCARDELLDLLKMGVFMSECEAIADKTPEKDWAQKLRTMKSYSSKIFDERLAALDPKAKATVLRRYKHSAIKFYTSDQNRIISKDDGKPESHVTVCFDDLFDLVDLALFNCKACPQGECIKQCYYRELFHRLGVIANKIEPQEGECEFSFNKVGEAEVPKHRLLKADFVAERI